MTQKCPLQMAVHENAIGIGSRGILYKIFARNFEYCLKSFFFSFPHSTIRSPIHYNEMQWGTKTIGCASSSDTYETTDIGSPPLIPQKCKYPYSEPKCKWQTLLSNILPIPKCLVTKQNLYPAPFHFVRPPHMKQSQSSWNLVISIFL